MGTGASKSSLNNSEFKKYINAVATKYILTQNFQDFIKLNDPKHCSNLVILTSKIMEKYLGSKEILYLDQYMKGDDVINRMETDSVMYLDKNSLGDLDIKNSIKKKRMCIGISKFYVKINMLFAAIITTIKPMSEVNKMLEKSGDLKEEPTSLITDKEEPVTEHSDADETHELKPELDDDPQAPIPQAPIPQAPIPQAPIPQAPNVPLPLSMSRGGGPEDGDEDEGGDKSTLNVPLEDKDQIPDFVPIIAKVGTNTFCSKRLEALMASKKIVNGTSLFKVQPKVCNISGTLKKEPGISELEDLYRDKFNYTNGEFNGMSDEMQEEYNQDIVDLQNVFSPDQAKVKKISQINMENFKDNSDCKPGGKFSKALEGSSPYFQEYAKRLMKLETDTRFYENELLEILKQVFYIDEDASPQIVTIRGSLDDKKLNLLMKETRKTIVKLYKTCEMDFQSIMQVYYEIVKQHPDISIAKQEQKLSGVNKEAINPSSVSDAQVKENINQNKPATTSIKEGISSVTSGLEAGLSGAVDASTRAVEDAKTGIANLVSEVASTTEVAKEEEKSRSRARSRSRTRSRSRSRKRRRKSRSRKNGW